MQNKRITVLSGAGISAESGLKTFRDSGGLWEGHNVYEVASIEGWNSDPEKVLEFYNQRRRQLLDVVPNDAHRFIAELEHSFDVTVVTQNVDDLHERAGSTNVVHLHGELKKGRSEADSNVLIDIEYQEIKLGDKAPDGYQIRPAIVWFGEMVPLIEVATEIVHKTDILIVIGTSLAVYPAAGLVNYAPVDSDRYIIDPGVPELSSYRHWIHIQKSAVEGVQELKKLLSL